MKLTSFFERRLAASYRDEDPVSVEIAKTLFVVTSALSAVALLMTVVIQTKGNERLLISGLFCILAALSVLTLFGKAKIASFLTTTVLSMALSGLVFLNPEGHGYFELYFIGFLNLFAMGLTVLVEYRSWQVFFPAAYSAFAIVLALIFRVVPQARAAGESPQIDDGAIVIILTFLVATSLNALINREKRFLAQSREATARADRQLGLLKGALDASTTSLAQGNMLSDSAKKTAAFAADSADLVKRAEQAMHALADDSRKLGDEIGRIGASSARARSSAEGQSSVINETSAAIEQMTASIRNINGVTRDRQGAVRELSKSTDDGRNIVSASSKSMGAVESSTGAILDIVNVISAVAAQTNLLAMNAAIEAAHAGEAGRGFAVVADEIRKLSEQTSKSVKAVTDTVKGTIRDIRAAADNNDRAVRSFETIAKEAELVSGAMQEIIDGLDELSKGTDEINRGVSDSVTSTNELRDAVAALDHQILKARESLTALEEASRQVDSDLTAVGRTIDSISSEAASVDAIGTANALGLSELNAALSLVER